MCPLCVWVIISYSSINSSDIPMSWYSIITIDIYVALYVMYNQFIRAYIATVSIWVKFNMNVIFEGTIWWLYCGNWTQITTGANAPCRQSLTSSLLLFLIFVSIDFLALAPIFPHAEGFESLSSCCFILMCTAMTLTFQERVATGAARSLNSLAPGLQLVYWCLLSLSQPHPVPPPGVWHFLILAFWEDESWAYWSGG